MVCVNKHIRTRISNMLAFCVIITILLASHKVELGNEQTNKQIHSHAHTEAYLQAHTKHMTLHEQNARTGAQPVHQTTLAKKRYTLLHGYMRYNCMKEISFMSF